MSRILIVLLLITSVFFMNQSGLYAQPENARIDREVRRELIRRITSLLASNYVDSLKGKEAGIMLTKRFENSAYKGYDHPHPLSELLTADLQKFLNDKHVRVRALTVAERQSRAQNPLFATLYDQYIKYRDNYGIRELKIFPENIGYLLLESFESLTQVRDRLDTAMDFLSRASALIIDLRQNTGGNPETVQYLCSFFFEQPTHINNQYWRRGDYTEEFWTMSDTGSEKLGKIPLFILTSNKTFSAAEEFAYDLQVQKRALIIGETTAGGANPGYTFSLSEYFVIFIPTGRPVNPLTGTNWEGRGVEPDISVPADKALDTALDRATLSGRRFSESIENEAIHGLLTLTTNLEKLTQTDLSLIRVQVDSLFRQAMRKNIVDESMINSIGYFFLDKRSTNLALAVFLFNVGAYPHSANVYDSLGEIYMRTGHRKKAIENYKRSLEINPQNYNARHMLSLLGVPGDKHKSLN